MSNDSAKDTFNTDTITTYAHMKSCFKLTA